MDSNWLPGLLGDGDDIRSLAPGPPEPTRSEDTGEDAATGADEAPDVTGSLDPQAPRPEADAESTADPSAAATPQPPPATAGEVELGTGEVTDQDSMDWLGEAGEKEDARSAESGALDEAARRERRSNGRLPTTTEAFSRWVLPPVRRIDTRRRKPVDPDKLPSYLRGHPRFER